MDAEITSFTDASVNILETLSLSILNHLGQGCTVEYAAMWSYVAETQAPKVGVNQHKRSSRNIYDAWGYKRRNEKTYARNIPGYGTHYKCFELIINCNKCSIPVLPVEL